MISSYQQQSSPRLAASAPRQSILSPASAPSHDRIARRAYDIYRKSGCAQSRCKQNWQQAQRELIEADLARREGLERVVENYDDVMPSKTDAAAYR